MTNFLQNYPNISNKFSSKPSYRYTSIKQYRGSWKDAARSEKVTAKARSCMVRNRGLKVCSSSTEERLVEKVEMGYGKPKDDKGQFDYWVSGHGWKVRRLVEDANEIQQAVQVQAEAFHVPVALFNDLFFQFFQAEVLSGLLYKLRNSPPDRYACLVADSESPKQVVGVVDVTVLREQGVVEHLQGAKEYLYVSGIAVLSGYRRQKVATVLLKACERLSILWGFEYLALRAYEDDRGARKLYADAGYRIVSGDPPWLTTWIGRKRRVLMIKRSNI